MAEKKPTGGADKPKLVRKSLMVDPTKLEQARKALGALNDADALRMALDHLLSHFKSDQRGEEE